MLASMSSAGLSEWMAFYQLEADDMEEVRAKARTERDAAQLAQWALGRR